MNNKKGYTLIEVVLSLAILGIISIGFLTVAGSNFSFFNKARGISQTVFETQQEIELFIDKVKEGIRQVRQEGENLTVGEVCPADWHKGSSGLKATQEGISEYLGNN